MNINGIHNAPLRRFVVRVSARESYAVEAYTRVHAIVQVWNSLSATRDIRTEEVCNWSVTSREDAK